MLPRLKIFAKVRANNITDVNGLLKSIVNNVKVISVNEVIPSMNDIFIQKVQEVTAEKEVNVE